MSVRSLRVAGRLVLAAAFVMSVPGFAQTDTATVRGQVTDSSGAIVPTATVRLVEVDRGTRSEATTNASGFYSFSGIAPGRYRMEVEKTNFKLIHLVGITVNVQDNLEENFKLDVGAVSESVTVEGGAPLVNTQDASVGTVVDRQFVANMPLNGRTFQSLILLSPGIVPTPASAQASGQFSVNGQRATSNYFSVDGVSANIGVGAAPGGLFDTVGGAAQATTAVGGYNNLISIDAIQEFRIQTSTFAPEFGRTPGGQFNFVTRSGSNQLHGTAFDYLRNDVLDANDWFANAHRQPRPPEKQNDFGGTFGGPVFLPRFGKGAPHWIDGRNRSFFFFSYEGLRLRQPGTFFGEVPSLLQRQTASAFYKPLLNVFPLPNGPTQPDGFALFAAAFSNPSTLDATSIRIDHTVNSRLTIFGRFNYSPSQSDRRMSSAGSSPNEHEVTFVRTQTLTVGGTQILRNTDANELRLNYSRNRSGTTDILDTFGGGVPVGLGDFVSTPVPPLTDLAMSILGGSNNFFGVGKLAENVQRQFNFVDTLSLSKGRHQIKAGVDYRRLTPIFNPDTEALTFVTALANLTTSTLSTLLTGTRVGTELSINDVSLFAQDTWHANSRLTVTYGLRWELNPPPSFHGTNPVVVSGFSLANPSAASIAPSGTRVYRTTYENFAPRVGIAYRLRESPRSTTVVRGGFGYFYDLGSTPVGYMTAGPPFSSSRSLSSVPLPPTAAQLAFPAVNTTPPFSGVAAFDPSLELPYTMQWNAALEQGIGANQKVTASYVASAGRRLLQGLSLPLPNAAFTGSFGFTGNLATSDYQSMQLQFQRRLSNGIQGLVSYTWSHSIDDQSQDVVAVTSTLARGNSNFDIRHRAAGAVTFDIPAPKRNALARAILDGWGLDPIFNLQSAAPVDLIGRTSVNIGGVIQTTRPNVVPGIPMYLQDSQYAGGKIINNTPNEGGAGCKGPFCPAPAGQQGNLGRNVIRGYPVSQLDLSLRRQFKINERLNLQFRCDVFNALNHPNFANPQTSLSSSLFGTTASTYATGLGTGGVRGGLNPLYSIGGPRSMQFSMKIIF